MLDLRAIPALGAESRNRTGLAALEAQSFALNKPRVGGRTRASLHGERTTKSGVDPEPPHGIEPCPIAYRAIAPPWSYDGKIGGVAGYRPRRACLQGRRAAFRTTPWQVGEESNLGPRIWSPLGHHGLRPTAPRTRIELVSLDRQSSCDTSRITRQFVLLARIERAPRRLGNAAPHPAGGARRLAAVSCREMAPRVGYDPT